MVLLHATAGVLWYRIRTSDFCLLWSQFLSSSMAAAPFVVPWPGLCSTMILAMGHLIMWGSPMMALPAATSVSSLSLSNF